jgi:hypothetical protein
MVAKRPMRNINLIILVIILLGSCKAKQIATTKETIIVHDTVRDLRTIEIIKPIHDTLTIENPCDSLGLKDFYYKSNLPHGKVIIRSLRGKIQATINMDSVANIYDAKYRSKYKNEVKLYEKEVVKNVIPMWAIITIFFESVIIIGFVVYRLSKLSQIFL